MNKKIMLGIGFAIFVISFYFIHLPEQPNSEFKMDIYSEYSSCIGNYHEEHLSIILNQAFSNNHMQCAKEILEKCQQNDFIDIDFSYDWSVPTTLYVVVYKNRYSAENGEMEFSFSYLPQDLSCDLYNIIDNPEQYILTIDD